MNDMNRDDLTPFSDEEQRVILALQARYKTDADLFTRREWAKIQFLRWLNDEGYFQPTLGVGSRGALHVERHVA
jgi:hypothetical protein